MSEEVYQASPSRCVSVAREALYKAEVALRLDPPDVAAAFEALGTVRAWLPSWLEREWDDRMAAWMAREGVPLAEPTS